MSTDAEHDMLDENEPVIVDCDVLEAAKENIQPLASGRRVTALSAILSTPHAQRESRLAATRNRLRMNVQLALENSTPNDDDEDEEEAEEADPLEAYCRYVYWVVENYPQGHSAESGLLELLEEATRVLKDHQGGKWRSDLRYLKLWVLYASYVEKPAVIFKFCMVNEIGTSHALLYEEFAIALERAGRKAQADETYRVGIARKAAPLERLEMKYKEFQKRMMASPTLPSTEDDPSSSTVPASSATQIAPRRTALGETTTSRTSTRTTRSSARTTPTTTPTFPQPARAQPNARMQVYVDPSPDAPGGAPADDDAQPSAWAELGTRKSRVKENVKEATKMAGSTLRQPGAAQRAAAAAARGAPKISVYRDPAPDADEDADDADARDMPPPPLPAAAAKSKKPVAVFRDAEEPSAKKTRTTKSAIPVFRDEEPSSSQAPARRAKGRTASKSSIPVFRDDDSAAEPSARSAKPKASGSKSAIAVFRDDALEESENRAAPAPGKAKSKIAVFRDDAPAAEASTAAKPAKSKIAVFRDEEPPQPAPPAKPAKTKLAVFRDPEPQDAPAAKAKGKIAVFRDDAPDAGASATPSFTPYRDDTDAPAPLTRTRSGTGPSSGVGLGLGLGAGAGGAGAGTAGGAGAKAKASSEAEALRRDPLKNYAEDERVGLE